MHYNYFFESINTVNLNYLQSFYDDNIKFTSSFQNSNSKIYVQENAYS